MTDSTPKTPSASPDPALTGHHIRAAFNNPTPVDPLYAPPESYSVAAIQFRHHSGPLPDPESLARYGAIDPTLPGRIMAMAERGHNAQIAREDAILQNTLSIEIIGRMFSLAFALAGLGLAAYALHLNYPKVAIAIVTVLLGGAVYTIATGKDGRKKDNRPDAPENPTN